MARKAKWPPTVYPHPHGQARVRIRGVDHWLGKYGSQEAADALAELIRMYPDGPPSGPLELPKARPAARPSVAEATAMYLAYAEGHYRDPDGLPTGEMGYVRTAVAVLTAVAGRTKADEFKAKAFKRVREAMVGKGWCRTNVNHHCNVVKRIFRWLAAEEVVPAENYQALRAIEPLKAGRCAAPESSPVRPPKIEHVEAVIPLLTPHLMRAARLQLATACRPGEVLRLRPSEIERRPGVWLWRPGKHKTRHHGRERVILIGPTGQAVIGEAMARRQGEEGSDYWLFSPALSESERCAINRARAKSPRPTPLLPGRRRGRQGERFAVSAYTKAIHRACDAAGVPRWSAHKLRHLAATRLAAEFGPLVAQTILGHASLRVTELYCQRDLSAAIDAIRRVG